MGDNKNSDARIRNNNRWTNAHYDRINLAVPKGKKEVIQTAAAVHGQSVNAYINRAVDDRMERDDAQAVQNAAESVSGSGGISIPSGPETPSEAAETPNGGVVMAHAERIRILLVKRGNISEAELARRLGISPQNLNNKMKRDNFTERDLAAIAEALNCTFTTTFTMNDTGETV